MIQGLDERREKLLTSGSIDDIRCRLKTNGNGFRDDSEERSWAVLHHSHDGSGGDDGVLE